MRRRRFLLMVVMVTAVLALLITSCRLPAGAPVTPEPTATPVPTPTPAPDEQTVFCQSIVRFDLPKQRWTAYVKHPRPDKESLEASLRQLKQEEVPAPFDPQLLDHYEVVNRICFKSWAQIFKLTDEFSLGAASRRLENPDVVTEFDMRRAILKIYFKTDWKNAEKIFPLQGK